MNTQLKENVKRMLEAGVPRDKIAGYVQKYGGRSETSTKDTPLIRQTTTGGGGGWSEPPQGQAWGDVASRALDNLGSSTKQFVKALASPVTEYSTFWPGLYTLAKGTAQKFIPGEQQSEYAFDAFVNAMKDRYGSIEAIKETLATDPVGALADVSSVFLAGGGVMRAAGAAPKLGVVGKAGRAAQGVGAVLDPVNIARQAVAAPLRTVLLGKFPERLYMSALKPSTRVRPQDRTALFAAAAKNKIPVSSSGVNRMYDIFDSNAPRVEGIVKTADAAGDTISAEQAIKNLDSTFDYYQNTVAPGSDVRVVDRVGTDFLDSHVSPEGTIPVGRAQKIKTNTQNELRKQFKNRGTPRNETRKAITAGLRQAIEEQYPEIGRLNANSAELRALEDALFTATGRIDNLNVLGVGKPLGATAGGAAGGWPGAIAGWATAALLDNPTVKSTLAIALARARKMPNYGQDIGATRIGAQAGAQAAEAIDQQKTKTAR